MQENLNENQPLEKLDVNLEDFDKFKENKCPIDLKTNEYFKSKFQFGKVSKKKFDPSIVEPVNNISVLAILLSFIYSFSFYILLLTFLLTYNTKILIFLIIVYILGTLFQFIVIPNPNYFKTKSDFETDINKILNSYVIIRLTNGKKTKKATYQAKYTIDITGSINIPKDINYVKIKGIQLYSKKDLNNLIKDFQMVNKSCKIDYKLMYNDEEINLLEMTYAINQKNCTYSINCFHTLYSILLIQWIYALFDILVKSKKCIRLFPAKLITNNFISSPSKFIVQGQKYEINSYVMVPIESNEEFDNDLAEFLRKKKEKEEREKKRKEEKAERERKRKENTKLLSKFKNGDNYVIKVKKIYDDVFLRFDAYTPKRHTWYETELGPYDKNAEERIVRGEKVTTYYPEGYDIRIEVIRGLYSYTVSIGDEYTENFEYRYN